MNINQFGQRIKCQDIHNPKAGLTIVSKFINCGFPSEHQTVHTKDKMSGYIQKRILNKSDNFFDVYSDNEQKCLDYALCLFFTLVFWDGKLAELESLGNVIAILPGKF